MICAVKDKTGSSIRRICDVLNVPRSGFNYAAKETPSQVSDGNLGDLIEDVFQPTEAAMVTGGLVMP